MIYKYLLVILTVTPLSLYANTNIEKGKELFKSSKCSTCHGTEVYTRKNRKINNKNDLEAQVRRCEANLSGSWFDDEIVSVAEYLGHDFYKFSEKNKELVIDKSTTSCSNNIIQKKKIVNYRKDMDEIISCYNKGGKEELMSLLLSSAKNNNPLSQLRLSKVYDLLDENEKSISWLKKSSENGNSEALFTLGYKYSKGEGVEESDEIAFKLRRKAALLGHTKAKYILAVYYEKSIGVCGDFEKSKYWYLSYLSDNDLNDEYKATAKEKINGMFNLENEAAIPSLGRSTHESIKKLGISSRELLLNSTTENLRLRVRFKEKNKNADITALILDKKHISQIKNIIAYVHNCSANKNSIEASNMLLKKLRLFRKSLEKCKDLTGDEKELLVYLNNKLSNI